MTREEAIEIIQKLIGRFKSDSRTYKALEMAIQALSQEPTNTWSIKDVADTFKKHGLIREQEPCDDAISRDELLKAIDTWDKFGYTETGCFVREPKGDYVPYIHYDDVIKSIKGMPSVTQKSESVTEFADRCRECGKRYVKIPDNATNGDMFRVFFPNGIEMQDLKNTTERWWNAPYQKGGKK